MDKFDEWLANKPINVKVEQLEPGVLMPQKQPFPWLNVIMGVALAVALYMLYTKDGSNPGPGPEPTPVVNVVEFVEKSTREYPVNLSNVFNKLATEVENKQINNGKELMPNAKAQTLDALTKSLGKINQLDTDNIPVIDEKVSQSWDDTQRQQVIKYLKLKAEGHLKASK